MFGKLITYQPFRQIPHNVYHLPFWGLYGLFFFSTHQGYGSPEKVLLLSVWYVVVTALAAYTNSYYLFDRLLAKQRFVVYTILFLATILLSSLLLWAGFYVLFYWPSSGLVNRPENMVDATLVSTFFTVTFFSAVILVEKWLVSQQLQQELRTQKLQAENQFLRSQVNPHFLFNALNSIYFLIEKDSGLAASTLITFSNMLRYQLYKCDVEHIAIEQEIAYLQYYIEMEKIRKGSSLAVNQTIGPGLEGFEIAPLLLQPFVENAFKYASAPSSETSRIDLYINQEETMLSFRIGNSLDPSLQWSGKGSGIGLTNVRRRLELLYPGKYSLRIDHRGDRYEATLQIYSLVKQLQV